MDNFEQTYIPENQGMTKAQSKPKKSGIMIAVILFITLGLVGLKLVPAHISGPVKEILLMVDVFGLSPISEIEKNRQNKINKLKITYEEKQALMLREFCLHGAE